MQSHMLSAHEPYTMDDTGYINLISYLVSMTPFEAIRQAEDINKVNGFEVVSLHTIRSWKAFLKNQNPIFISKKSNWNCYKGNGFSKIKYHSTQSKFEKLELDQKRVREYQKAYVKLLN